MEKLRVVEAKHEAVSKAQTLPLPKSEAKTAPEAGQPPNEEVKEKTHTVRKAKFIKRKKETRKETIKTSAVKSEQKKDDEDEWEDQEEDDFPAVKLRELLSELTLNDSAAKPSPPPA